VILLSIVFVASSGLCSSISIFLLSGKVVFLSLWGISVSVGYVPSGYVPSEYVAGIFLVYVFLLVGFGYLLGSFLAKTVRAKLMMAGSLVYWMVALANWLYLYFFSYYRLGLYQFGVFSLLSGAFFYSMIPVLSIDLTYMVKYLVKRRKT
jgi:hypothetical protein